MNVSKYKMVLNPNNLQTNGDKYLDIPIELKWSELGQDDSIDEIQERTVEEVIGKPTDFDCARFGNKTYPFTTKSDINYVFNFFDSINGSLSNPASWINSYEQQGFDINETYFITNSFAKSFFKLDLYDTDDARTQINYLTLIISTNQSTKIEVVKPFLPETKPIKIPKFTLDYIGNKESFFIYWLKNTNYLNLTTFYMSAKFFNAKTGEFVRMMNRPQSSISTLYNFNQSDYFYYKVKLSYSDYTYEIFDYTSQNNEIRKGSSTAPINWYQYVNP
jgi:hypothetical protein